MAKRFNSQFTRRSILRSVGAGAVLAPFIPLLNSSARESVIPTRLLLVFSPDGMPPNMWLPTGSENAFDLKPVHAPLEAHTQDIVVLNGIRLRAGGAGATHNRNMCALWTGSGFTGVEQDGWAAGESIDQAVATVNGSSTPFRSLEAAAFPGPYNDGRTRMCFTGADQPIVPENDPRDLFDRLFATLSQSQVELDRVRQRRASIIDLVTGELEAAAKRYGAEDRLKVEAHLDALRAIEQRLESLVDCGDVAAPPGNLDPGNNDAFPDVVDLHSDLIVRALACDLTRVASMQWSYSGGAGVRFNWLGVSGTYHSQVIHEPGTDADVAKVNTWFSEQFATLLDRLAAVPEGNGTMLDNTLVVWGRDMAVGAGHGLEPLPVILAGRAGGRLATGRYLQFPAQDHQRLLVSVAQAVGLDDVTSFGTLDTGSGPLPGLLA